MEKWQNLGYLFWAYTLFWGLLAGYLFIMGRKLSRLREEMQALRRSGNPESRSGPASGTDS